MKIIFLTVAIFSYLNEAFNKPSIVTKLEINLTHGNYKHCYIIRELIEFLKQSD